MILTQLGGGAAGRAMPACTKFTGGGVVARVVALLNPVKKTYLPPTSEP